MSHQEVVTSWVLSDLYVNFTFRTFGVELFELIVHDGFGTLQDVELAFSGREENLFIILTGLKVFQSASVFYFNLLFFFSAPLFILPVFFLQLLKSEVEQFGMLL